MRRPPYAARVAEILRNPGTWPQYVGTSADGMAVTIWIACGPEAWRYAHDEYQSTGAHRLLLVAPPDSDPAALDWSMCAGHPPVLIWPCGATTDEQVSALAAALLRDGVERVLVLDDAGTRYQQGGAVDAA